MRPSGRVGTARFRRGTARLPIVSLLAVFGLSLFADLPKFLHRTDLALGFFADDFYYYLKVAQSLAQQHRSSFNGFMLTNGYHPLWLLVLALFWKITSSLKAILVLVSFAVALSVTATFWFTWRLCLRLSESRDYALLVGFAAAFLQHEVSCWGMEPILAVPFALGLLETVAEHSPGESRVAAFCFGLLGAFAVLARLDLALLVGLLGLLFLPELLARLRFLWALLGAVPLALYLAVNRYYFHLWLPVSGLAKQLKPLGFHWPHLEADGIIMGFAASVAVAALPALLIFAQRPVVGSGGARAMVAALLFPLLFFLVQAMVSDWQMWDWYAYPFVVALPAASIVLAPLLEFPLFARVSLILASTVLVAVSWVFSDTFYRLDQPTPMVAFAEQLVDFAKTHPGRYAMGDRAGIVGFLLPQPVLQLEGLMGDRKYLARVRARQNLLEAMHAYHVVYYIAENPRSDGACWLLSEPFKAGPRSPRMSARLCARPLLSVVERGVLTQRVFRVDGITS